MKSTSKAIRAMLFTTLFTLAAVTCVISQDATQADAKHYKVEFENDQVRVLRVNYGPKERSIMHYHPEGLAIALTATQTKFTLADGKTEERGFKAGQTLWTPAGTHLPENLGGKAFEVILIELKDGSNGGAMPAASDDPIKVDAKYHKLEFENDRVRVMRGTVPAKQKTAMHAHPGNIVIFLNGGRVRSILADGKTEEAEAKNGQVAWRGPVKHVSENLSDKPIEVIVVELKGK